MSNDYDTVEGPTVPYHSGSNDPLAELVRAAVIDPPATSGGLRTLDGRFEIIKVLGKGGMGIVVLARVIRQTEGLAVGSLVAIKLLQAQFLEESLLLKQFLREPRIMRELAEEHANWIPVLAVSENESKPYFVMPYVENGSVASKIRPSDGGPARPLEETQVRGIALQVADALRHAHEKRGFFHRDVKPANLLLDQDQHVFVTDLGLLRTSENDTLVAMESDLLVGTLPYMPPRAVKGYKDETTSWDIYSFGATLYEMVTDHPPYQGRTRKEIIEKILAGPPEPIQAEQASPGVRRIIQDTMQYDMHNRYVMMADVLADLRNLEQGRPPLGARARDQARRSRRNWLIAAAAAVLLVAVAAATYFAWLSMRPHMNGNQALVGNDSKEKQQPAVPFLPGLAFTIEHFQGNTTTKVGTIGITSKQTHFDDSVKVRLELSEEAYCYLIAFNPDGKLQLCYPSDRAKPPAPIQTLTYPGNNEKGEPLSFALTDGVGLQVFALIRSPHPLPAFAEWEERVSPFPWKPVAASGWWLYDGRSFRGELDRGPERVQVSTAPEPFRELAKFLTMRLGPDAVQAIAFTVREKP